MMNDQPMRSFGGRKRKTLDAWIIEALTDPDKDGPCHLLSLVHMVGTTPEEVHSRKIAPGVNANELADLFRGKAEAFAQDLPGAQTFALLAFYAGTNEPQAKFPFVVTGDVNAESMQGYLTTETPTPQGEKQQSMRHNETILGLAFRQTAMLFSTHERILASMAEREQRMFAREERLMHEAHEAYDVVRELLEERSTQHHERETERLKFERATSERKKLLTFLPALANTLLGQDIFPQASADTALFETIADSLSEPQIQQLASTLPPELWGPLATRMKSHFDKKQAEKRETEAARGLLESSGSTSETEIGE